MSDHGIWQIGKIRRVRVDGAHGKGVSLHIGSDDLLGRDLQ